MKRKAIVATALLVGACGTAPGAHVRPFQSDNMITAKASGDHYQMGKTYLRDKQTGLAIEAFRRDLALKGPSVNSLNGLGVAYARLGRHDLAQSYFDQALGLDPYSTTTTNNMAMAMMERGDYEQAVALVEEQRAQVELATNRLEQLYNRTFEAYELNVAQAPIEQEPVRRTVAAAAPRKRVEKTGVRTWTLADAPQAPDYPIRRKTEAKAIVRPIQTAKIKPDPVAKSISPTSKLTDAEPVQDVEAFSPIAVTVVVAPDPIVNTELPTAEIAESNPDLDAEVILFAPTTVENEPELDVQTAVLDTSSIRLENGAGKNGMAAEYRGILNGSGLSVNHIANADHYNYDTTIIRYMPGHKRNAVTLAQILGVSAHFESESSQRNDLVVVLGSDLADAENGAVAAIPVQTLEESQTAKRNTVPVVTHNVSFADPVECVRVDAGRNRFTTRNGRIRYRPWRDPQECGAKSEPRRFSIFGKTLQIASRQRRK